VTAVVLEPRVITELLTAAFLSNPGQYSNMRQIIYANSIFSPYIILENTKKQNASKSFPLVRCYECTTILSPGKNRKIWGTSLILRPCPEHCNFASTHLVIWTTKALRVGPTDRYTRPQNPKLSAFKFAFVKAYVDVKGMCCYMIQSSCC